ncbi:MAG: DNA-directed RNA polymerase subunit alpha [Candidatus Brocadiales bacterium]|nr:DNA-directed RNA polymerase subunit alpha [Candidatus Bathyanammoxibius amoris]
MRIRWRGFELPTRITVDQETLTDTYGKFTVEPFERGYGITIGNSLRRVLLSSLEGSAATTVKFAGVKHEFTYIPGVVEDVTDILLNIKSIVVKLQDDQPRKLKIEARKKGEVKAKDIITEGDAEIINPDLHIATLSDNVSFKVEMEVRKGRGYVTAEENEPEEPEIGLIALDSIFSPVRKVKFYTEDTRVGRKTNYDKLIIEMWTNGVVSPQMALVEAAKILRKHLNPFVQLFEIGRELPRLDMKPALEAVAESKAEVTDELQAQSEKPVTELDLSVRASNCLEAANIKAIGELISLTEDEVLSIRNFGRTTLKEVKKKLAQLGLSFGMQKKEKVSSDET